MTRTLSLSDKQFIENQRKLGKSCQEIAIALSIQVRLVYKWTAILKKTYHPPSWVAQ
jgi:DNA-binding CsgD family transcriptional regulator